MRCLRRRGDDKSSTLALRASLSVEQKDLKDVHGKVQGLKASQLRRLERLQQRSGSSKAVCEPALARALTECCVDLGRMVGVLMDRRGGVSDVVVGEPTRLYLPDIGRLRAGPGRLRGLRLVVARPQPKDPKKAWGVDQDLLTDLERLKLDAVVEIEAREGGDDDGLPGRVAVATVLPVSRALLGEQGEQGEHERTRTEHWRSIHEAAAMDFGATVEALEAELAQTIQSTRDAGPGERDVAVLVGVYHLPTRKEAQDRMDELKELAATAGVRVVDEVVQYRRLSNGDPDVTSFVNDPKYVVGKGRLEEICLAALHKGAELVIFDGELTPSQMNAITDVTDLKIVDRTMLILDIFAHRAKSREGRMQVELAQLRYSVPRLAKKQEGLSRLTGGIGGQGPGETKLEIDRRRAKEKITRLEREIDQFSRDRQLRRRRRDERKVPIIAIVGYTNAGKSTLLNRLTGSDVYAADELFATLDTTSRRLRFPAEREVVLTDTVGFIRDLPEPLVNAFRATLEELHEADLLLHVVDGQDPLRHKHVDAVMRVLDELGLLATPRLLVLNKGDDKRSGKHADRRADGTAQRVTDRAADHRSGDEAGDEADDDVEARRLGAVRVSALTGDGLPVLVNRMADLLWQEEVVRRRELWAPSIPPAEAREINDEAFPVDVRSYR